ncbi:MAG: hypothetical protein KDB82_07380 [Planctomycetes bacterium]|nr:hypothetical protein [Planctomycetota bacterium]
MKRATLLIIALLLLLPAAGSLAQDLPTPAERFANLDTDKDGFVTPKEFKATAAGNTNPAYWWGLYIAFLSADTDDDLRLTVDELTTYANDESAGTKHKLFVVDRTAAMKEIFPSLDADTSGKVSFEEWKNNFEYTGEFAEIDANSDNGISRDELWNYIWSMINKGYDFIETGADNPDKDKFLGDRKDYPLYVTGREWKLKTTVTLPGGKQSVSYTSWLVKEVSNERASCRMRMLDADARVTFTSDRDVRFMKKKPGKVATVEPVIETVTVPAGEFECIKIEQAQCTLWTSKQYPGLLVKSRTTGMLGSLTELVEFKAE